MAVVADKQNKFRALRQMSLYVLQFWEVARFVEVKDLKIGELVRGKDYYHLFITRVEAGGSRRREVIQIYSTPPKFHKIFVQLPSCLTTAKLGRNCLI